MAFYFIDYENVNNDGMQGVELLHSSDEVIIFYSDYADRLTFDLHQRINASAAKVQYIRVDACCKKNGLDFQLVTYLGYLIAQHPTETFYIVSKDNGFCNVVKFWAERQINVSQLDMIDAPATVQSEEKDPLLAQVEKLFADKTIAAVVTDCVRKSKDKQELHNRLAAEFRDERVTGCYKKVKHLL